MISEGMVEELRERLMTQGAAFIIDGAGRRLWMIHLRLLRQPEDGLLVAYEGVGTFTFDLQRPANKFRLVSAGFRIDVADYVADLVNRVTRVGQAPQLSPAVQRPKGLTYAPKRVKE